MPALIALNMYSYQDHTTVDLDLGTLSLATVATTVHKGKIVPEGGTDTLIVRR